MEKDYFDFQQVTEEDEAFDYKRLEACPHCKKAIPHNAIMCFYCGEDASRHHNKKTWVFWTALFLLIIFIVFIFLY